MVGVALHWLALRLTPTNHRALRAGRSGKFKIRNSTKKVCDMQCGCKKVQEGDKKGAKECQKEQHSGFQRGPPP